MTSVTKQSLGDRNGASHGYAGGEHGGYVTGRHTLTRVRKHITLSIVIDIVYVCLGNCINRLNAAKRAVRRPDNLVIGDDTAEAVMTGLMTYCPVTRVVQIIGANLNNIGYWVLDSNNRSTSPTHN